jgi:predicted aspartyl protease
VSTACEMYRNVRLSLFNAMVPVPEIPLQIRTQYGYHLQWFLIDTGADISILPLRARHWIDCKLERRPSKVYGLEGSGVVVYRSTITIRIGIREFRIRCLFSRRDDVPFILGRLDLLKKCNINLLKEKACLVVRRK